MMARGLDKTTFFHFYWRSPMKSLEEGRDRDGEWVYCPYVVRNGKRIYPRNARFFRFRRRHKKTQK